MTKQKIIRGRDFDRNHKKDLAKYFISWADFPVRKRDLPLEYISFYNEGDDWQRWPVKLSGSRLTERKTRTPLL